MASQLESGRLRSQFFLPQQEQSNWCWAAIGVALARYFHGQQRAQCELVQAVNDPPGIDCCATPDDPSCNAIQDIANILQAVGVLPRAHPAQPQGTISYEEIQEDIANDRPIICTMMGQGGVHYLVVVGWLVQDETRRLVLDDPADGYRKRPPFDEFNNDFEGRQWIETTRLVHEP